MVTAPATHLPPSRPSWGLRLLAWISLLTLTAAAAILILELAQSPGLLVGAVGGLAIVVASAWWVVTEPGWRRWAGAVGLAAGVGVIVGSVLVARGRDDGGSERLIVLVLLLAVAITTARAALARSLHSLDPYPRFRPERPVLICNPKSGGGKVDRFGLVERARELGVEVVLLTPGSDLLALARDAVAKGADCLGMAGGDGSQALVASVAVEHGLPFVVISAGTRNHFALDLGLDRDDPLSGMAAFHDGVVREIDYATVGDRLFVNNVSLGVYAAVVEEEGYREAKVETSLTRLPELLGRQAEPFDLQFTAPDGTDVDGAFLVLVSNNPYVLGPALDVAQRRALDTGQLGVFAVTARTGAEASAMVTRAAVGLGTRDPHLFDFATATFEVRSRSGAVWAGIDGESVQVATPLEFAIHPRGLRLLVPRDSIRRAELRRTRGLHVSALASIALGRPPRTDSRISP